MYLNHTSSINSSFKKKRRASFFKKFGFISIIFIILISLLVWLSYWEKVKVQHITVSGNSSISEEDILNVVKADMEKKYIWLIRTDNYLLLGRKNIEYDILDKYKKIESAKVSFSDMNSVDIKLVDRVARSFWCKDDNKCFFMDDNGFIFSEAPDIAGSDIFKYSGLVDENFIGSSYFNADIFGKINKFISDIKGISFDPGAFNAIDMHEYEIHLISGGKILLNDDKGFEASFIKLKALVDNGYIKTTPDFLRKINYIDLRFGDKVSFKLK